MAAVVGPAFTLRFVPAAGRSGDAGILVVADLLPVPPFEAMPRGRITVSPHGGVSERIFGGHPVRATWSGAGDRVITTEWCVMEGVLAPAAGLVHGYAHLRRLRA